MSAAIATSPRVRSAAECRADEIVAAFGLCATAGEVHRTIDRARASMNALRVLADTSHHDRALAAQAAAFHRCVPPPQPLPAFGAHAAAEAQVLEAMKGRGEGASR